MDSDVFERLRAAVPGPAGPPDLAAIERRGRTLRRRRYTLRALIAALVVAAPAVAVAVGRDDACGPRLMGRPPAPSAIGEAGFIAPTRTDGCDIVMPVTLPDGNRIEIRYSSQISITPVEVQFTIGLDLNGCCTTYLSLAPSARMPRSEDAGKVLKSFAGTDGRTVKLFRTKGWYAEGRPIPEPIYYLFFEAEGWAGMMMPLAFGETRTVGQMASFAKGVRVTRAPDGFPLVHLYAPVRQASPVEEGGVPLRATAHLTTPELDIGVTPDGCRPGGRPALLSDELGNRMRMCRDAATVEIRTRDAGGNQFVDEVIRSLHIRDLRG